jgi:hypothetical protein
MQKATNKKICTTNKMNSYEDNSFVNIEPVKSIKY